MTKNDLPNMIFIWEVLHTRQRYKHTFKYINTLIFDNNCISTLYKKSLTALLVILNT